MKKLILAVATGNKHKINEFKEIFRSLDAARFVEQRGEYCSEHCGEPCDERCGERYGQSYVEVISESEAIALFRDSARDEYSQPDETGSTFAENAFIKASSLYRFLEMGIRSYMKNAGSEYNIIVAADDSGLCVDALGGAPGVMSARYASTTGENASDIDNVNKLLENMKNVPDGMRSARFMCSISALLLKKADAPFELITSEGSLNGFIAHEAHGKNGFGYDPVMYVPELGKCVAELSPEIKNAISHRGQALKRLAAAYFSLYS